MCGLAFERGSGQRRELGGSGSQSPLWGKRCVRQVNGDTDLLPTCACRLYICVCVGGLLNKGTLVSVGTLVLERASPHTHIHTYCSGTVSCTLSVTHSVSLPLLSCAHLHTHTARELLVSVPTSQLLAAEDRVTLWMPSPLVTTPPSTQPLLPTGAAGTISHMCEYRHTYCHRASVCRLGLPSQAHLPKSV